MAALLSLHLFYFLCKQKFPDTFCKNEIMKLEAICPNHETGCKWKGTMEHLDVRHCSSFVVVVIRNTKKKENKKKTNNSAQDRNLSKKKKRNLSAAKKRPQQKECTQNRRKVNSKHVSKDSIQYELTKKHAQHGALVQVENSMPTHGEMISHGKCPWPVPSFVQCCFHRERTGNCWPQKVLFLSHSLQL